MIDRKNGRPLKAIKLGKLFYSAAIIATAIGRSGNTTDEAGDVVRSSLKKKTTTTTNPPVFDTYQLTLRL